MGSNPLWWIPKAPDSVVNYDKDNAPYGVIFDGPDKAYVGSPHGEPITLSENLKSQLQKIASKQGVWYEGDGKDVAQNKNLFGGLSSYKGSWDDMSSKEIKGYPPEYLSGLFSNTDINGQKTYYINPERSIYDSILNNQDKTSYFKDRKFDSDTLTTFLKNGSEKDVDLLSMAKLAATKENVDKFFSTGESLMWPEKDWDKYPNNLGKYAEKFEKSRNNYLLNSGPGVYVVGSGHLSEITKSNNKLRLIGGQKAND